MKNPDWVDLTAFVIIGALTFGLWCFLIYMVCTVARLAWG